MTVLVSDSFNRTNSTTTLGSTDSYNGGTSKTWVNQDTTGAWGISSNHAYVVTDSSNRTVNVVAAGISDGIVECDVNWVTSSSIGLTFRNVDRDNMFDVYVSPTGLVMRRYVAGAVTNIGTYSFTPVTNTVYHIAINLNGNSIVASLNGTSRITVTDSNFVTATQHGLRSPSPVSGNYHDNFQISNLNTGTTGSTNFDSKQIIYNTNLTNYDLKQVLYSSSLNNFDSKQVLYQTGTQNYDSKQILFNTSLSNYDMEQSVYNVDATAFDVRQNIYDQSSFNIDTKQILYNQSNFQVDTEQVIYQVASTLFDTLQQIYDGGIIGSSSFDTKMVLYSDNQSIYDTKQSIYQVGADNYDLKQAIYQASQSQADMKLVLFANDSINNDMIQKIYSEDSTSFDMLQNIFDPDHSVIGTINLKGNQKLSIYLVGKQSLNVNLQGKQVLNVVLKGGVN